MTGKFWPAAAVLVVLGAALPATDDAKEADKKGLLVGRWKVLDPDSGAQLMGIKFEEIEKDRKFGKFKETADNKLQGANGLSCHYYRYEKNELAFVEPKTTRVDEMLVGDVDWKGNNKFIFKIAGGYYGKGGLSGKKLEFHRD